MYGSAPEKRVLSFAASLYSFKSIVADIPVIEMSLDYYQTPRFHYELAYELKSLRDKGVLIIGSGNMVHNLRMVSWNKLNESFGFDWALEIYKWFHSNWPLSVFSRPDKTNSLCCQV